MANPDFRVPMSHEAFKEIGDDDEYPLDPYYESLIANNPRFRSIDYEAASIVHRLTKGQRLLVLLGIFDGQVNNGGIVQFFWNYPAFICDVQDALEELAQSALLQNYEKALETLNVNRDEWEALGKHRQFQEACDLLDLKWFDDQYHDRYGYNDDHEWVMQSRGLNRALSRTLVEYVKTNADEFITGTPAG